MLAKKTILTTTLTMSCAVLILLLNSSCLKADALESLESYAQWVDVTNQTGVGTWTKVDSPNPVTNQGELVVAPAHGSVTPYDGLHVLDLRTNSIYESGGDGANYSYSLNTDDFDGLTPATHDSGTVELSYVTCPDTWSGEGGNSFIPEGIYQTTNLYNGNGDVLASIGMYSLGNQNSPVVHFSVDGANWISTGLQADSSSWTNVSMLIDLDAKTSSFSFTDHMANTFSAPNVSWTAGITDTTVQTLNLQMDDLVSKNYFDDFQFTPTISAVPEPSSAMLFALVWVGCAVRRKRN